MGTKVKVMVGIMVEIIQTKEDKGDSSIADLDITISLRVEIVMLQMQISYQLKGNINSICTTASGRMRSRLQI